MPEPDNLARAFDSLPQIFWKEGSGWDEVNQWALSKLVDFNIKVKTVDSLMKHMHAYAVFLESRGLDWRHFPIKASERALVRFRGHLMNQIKDGSLASSTARSRMNAVVQFYRHAQEHEFIQPAGPLWRDRQVVIPYYDAAGFKRALVRASTDLSISSQVAPGVRLEDGLLPLNEEHMTQLLQYTARHQSTELHLMLSVGFFTGARLETITTLRIENLEESLPHPLLKGFWELRVGPGTGVATKFDVQGALLVPDFILFAIKDYAFSTVRLKRETRASEKDRSLVFLTVRGGQYTNAVSSLMTVLRRDCVGAGLMFMSRFKFHETRATYGTWLMKLALGVMKTGEAIELVKSAMLHKHEAATFRYVKFLEDCKGKQEISAEFNRVFTGLVERNWDDFHE